MSYNVNFTAESIQDLKKIDNTKRSRIVRKIKWLSENFLQITPLPLTGNLSGYYKLRIGDYRVIYTVQDSENSILIHQVGHRRDIYNL